MPWDSLTSISIFSPTADSIFVNAPVWLIPNSPCINGSVFHLTLPTTVWSISINSQLTDSSFALTVTASQLPAK